jgi:hypothetical protein
VSTKSRSVIEFISLGEIARDTTPSGTAEEAIERCELLGTLAHLFSQPLADVAGNTLARLRRFNADPGGHLFLEGNGHVFHGSIQGALRTSALRTS